MKVRSNKDRRSNKAGRINADHLPQEIMEDILVKLPLKSIIRFKCVSKSFLNLIKSSHFIHRHLTETEESFLAMCLIVSDGDFEDLNQMSLSLSSYDDHKETSDTWSVLNFELLLCGTRSSDIYLVGHCYGIMCLTNYEHILLVNPSLAEIKLLPIPPAGENDFKLVGFGFDNVAKDFKVVAVMILGSGEAIQQKGVVYSLSSDSWEELDEIPLVVDDSTHCSTFFNGAVHWCIETKVEGEPFSRRILTFNLATELFQQIDFPQGWCTEIHRTVPSLFVLNQEALAFVSYGYRSEFVNVWIMTKHGSSEETWTKLYSLGPLTHFVNPISFLRKHKFLYKADNDKLILYDILNNHSSIVCDYHSRIPPFDSDSVLLCLELGVCRSSLISINTHAEEG